MSTPESWGLTPREFQVREEVREAYLALWLSETRNSGLFTRTDKRAWTIDDFLNTPDALARKYERTKKEAERLRGAMRANASIAGITANTSADKLPDWAVKKWVPIG